MKILITGKNGQLGKSIKRLLDEKCIDNLSSFSFIFTSREELNLENLENIQSYFVSNDIDVIINCAAYTKVDQAEEDQNQANLINHNAVRELAKISKKYKIKLIHISTDFVFNGHKEEPYTEDDEPSPLNIYGETKLAGELAIISTMPFNSIIIRTGWVYSEFGNNFVKTILNLASKNNALDIVSDQIGTPTYAYDLAHSILNIVSDENFLENEKPTAILHYSNEGESSWYEFAKEIISISGINCNLNPIKTKDYPLPAKRPKYSILSKKKISQEYSLNIDHWKDALKACLQNL
ncbi:dTDP-4-dehydrorhamnose reductase [Candidatus Pseudothioglobus singularis]|jgi:dTDP-4-dehydrorhamnose reductase|uniref:dTDP-4-dehydrorhamnose reductase n=1 Tax=Candidatus Pseudothioglobus singularis PS1 TaxID=1125411 RepID=A0A0M3T248_9GAMM|nr:dTDP-4-dehydrorhamnose reductase [Candidatus Pseudothioglobus singularis]ALE02191.1 dTDP-4-dehydrorhamnose reductase [Candidatus Pseudothioglobus singularis PS1]